MATKTPTMFETRNDLPAESREKLVELLNARLADTFDLYSQIKQAHWSVRGPDFIQLHLLYDTVAESVLGFVDEIAERATSLGGLATGTVRMAAEATTLDEYPLDADVRPGHGRRRRRPARRLRRRGASGDRDGRLGARRHGHLGPVHRDLARDRQAPLVRRGAPPGRRVGARPGRAAQDVLRARPVYAACGSGSSTSARCEERAEALGLEQLPSRRPRAEAELVEDARASGVQRLLARAPLARRASRGAPRSASGASNTRRTTSCGATVPFQRFSLSRNATSKRPARLKAVELRALPERDRGAAVAALLADAEAEVLPLADGAARRRLDARDEQRRLRVAEPERGEAVELLGEVERQRARRDDRVDGRERAQVDVGERFVGVPPERRCERRRAAPRRS